MANKILKVSDDVTKRASQLLKKLKARTITFEEDIELDHLMNVSANLYPFSASIH